MSRILYARGYAQECVRNLISIHERSGNENSPEKFERANELFFGSSWSVGQASFRTLTVENSTKKCRNNVVECRQHRVFCTRRPDIMDRPPTVEFFSTTLPEEQGEHCAANMHLSLQKSWLSYRKLK